MLMAVPTGPQMSRTSRTFSKRTAASRGSSLDETKTLSFAKAEDRIEVPLTDATSFLGGRLLRALVLSPRVRKVHCIAVPPDDEHLLY
jgi:hypothetical protein